MRRTLDPCEPFTVGAATLIDLASLRLTQTIASITKYTRLLCGTATATYRYLRSSGSGSGILKLRSEIAVAVNIPLPLSIK